MSVVSLYSYFCMTENVQKVEWLDSGPPIHCRDDPDGTLGHQISDIFVKDMINNSSVYIQGKTFDASTGGNYSLRGGSTAITSNAQTIQNIEFNIPMSIYGMYFQTGPEHYGDNIDIIYRPQTIVGTITNNVNINDTTFYIDSNVLNSVQLGLYFILTDGISYFDEIGMIINIDRNQSTISTDQAAVKTYNSGINVGINAYIVRGYPLLLPYMHKICRGVSGSKLMEQGSVMQLRYNNSTGVAKTFSYSYECIY